MKVTKEMILLTITLSTISLAGMIADLLLSLNAFMKRPEYFILHESNAEITAFFAHGVFPYITALTFIAVPFSILLVIYIAKRQQSKYSNPTVIFLSMYAIFVFVGRVSAGSTWYVSWAYEVFSLCRVLGIIALGTSILLLIAIITEQAKERRVKYESSDS